MSDLFERPPAEESSRSRAAMRERRAENKRKRRRRRNSVVVAISLVAIVAGGFLVVKYADTIFDFDVPFQVKDYPGPGHGSVVVTVPEGASGAAIGEILVEAGVVESTKAFIDAYNANPGALGIQPGTYELKLEMTAADAVELLAKGQTVDGTKLTIPEGQTVAQIVEKASAVTGIPAADFKAALEDPASFGLPAEAGGNPEGWLWATTYVLEPEETATSILTKMVTRTVQELDGLGVDPALREEVLIKASLIEREAKRDEDRPKMAQAINNRLSQGKPLQIDASASYFLGRKATAEDLKDPDNPYNTYKIPALPPGPIASPSFASIQAVLAPEPGDWIYWVTVNPETGETKFAVTFDEHEANVDELAAWEKANATDE